MMRSVHDLALDEGRHRLRHRGYRRPAVLPADKHRAMSRAKATATSSSTSPLLDERPVPGGRADARQFNDVTGGADGRAIPARPGQTEGQHAREATSGNYESRLRLSGRTFGKFPGPFRKEFDPAPAWLRCSSRSRTRRRTSSGRCTLFWADPIGNAADGLRRLLFTTARQVVSFSQNVARTADDDPFEILSPSRRPD